MNTRRSRDGERAAGESVSSAHVPPTEQLVTEIVVRDIRRSTEFYRRLGFRLHRDGGDFVELAWEGHLLFLAERSAFHGIPEGEPTPPPRFPVANVRVMVPNVDECWSLVNALGAPIVLPLADRYYGLRDFTIADPDGFGIRFASELPR
jgi:catechol 2,3-dioxygenase-like lactoylglutathione lyase family enzyme